MEDKINRSRIIIGKPGDLEKEEKEYWIKANPEEKLKTITYLRECFYGKKATTGRLQRVYTVFKRK